MTFDYPFLLGAFIIFIFMFLLDMFSPFRKYRQKLPEEMRKKLLISSFLFRIFLAFTIIALSGPRWGTGFTVSEYRRGMDIIFAVDVSRSMDIRDTQTSAMLTRLEHGVLIAKDSLPSVSGARFAAVIGRSKGYLAVPLSYDNEAVINFFESLDVLSLTGRSTNLESLVETAAQSFQNTSPARKVIVLISDGESHSGTLRNALNLCVTNGIIVTTIAVGSNEGGLVPLDASHSQIDEPSSGIISRRDTVNARTAAERTGGIFIDANRQDAASVLSTHLISLAQGTRTGNKLPESKQRRTLFVILAIVTYGAYKFIPRLSARFFISSKNKLPLVSIIAIALFLSSCSKGKILLFEANYLFSHGRYSEAVIPYIQALDYKDAAPYAEYGLGLTLYSIDESAAALKRYDNSEKMLEALSENEHRELRYRNYYNSGIIYFESGDFQSAAEAFKEALRADPEKLDAKRNLELSIMSIVTETRTEKRGESQNETREIIFNYIKEQEQQHWKSREWTAEETFSGQDY